MKKLCCIFNYAPLYRESIYLKIDEAYDAQFYFSDMKSDIVKMDYQKFKKTPKEMKYHLFLKHIPWFSGLMRIPFRKYDYVLMIGDYSFSFYPFIILCHLMGTKVYAWGHGNKTFSGKHFLFKGLYKLWDGFFSYGEGGKKRLVELGIPESKLYVIYNSLNEGVNHNSYDGLVSEELHEHFGNTLPIVLFVGRLTKVKKLDWIVNALADHRSKGLLYNVLFIGDGPVKKELINLAKEKNVTDSIWFYGKCYDESLLNKLIFNCDLCVSPGNVGLTALHAMTYGTPVISHDNFEIQMPEYETIIPKVSGDLYEFSNYNDFCQKIEGWLTAGYNRNSIRENCIGIINGRFNSRYQIDLIKSVLKQ